MEMPSFFKTPLRIIIFAAANLKLGIGTKKLGIVILKGKIGFNETK